MRWLAALSIKNMILIIGFVGIVGFAINLMVIFKINNSNQIMLL